MRLCERERANMGVCVYVCVCLGDRAHLEQSLTRGCGVVCVCVSERERPSVCVAHSGNGQIPSLS